MKHRVFLWIGIVVAVLAAAIGGTAAWYFSRNMHMFDRQMKAVYKAGYRDKTAAINGGTIAYLEGPDNGPALLLIHGQMVDAYNYAPALPELARSFHVFAVDCYGHGRSDHNPDKYSNVVQGQDLLAFILDVIGEQVLITGHSSGGIIAARIAANSNGWVRGVLFEDPPFFTLSLPRTKTTWNWVDLAATAHNFLEGGKTDWTIYSFEHSRMLSFFGEAGEKLIDQARQYHGRHPDGPIKIFWLPPIINESFRGIPNYDPRFGDVFYRGAWEDGFDLEEALKSITVPTTYQKSEANVDTEGILQGATSNIEAERARGLLEDVQFYTDNRSHSWHWQEPQEFVQRLLELQQRVEDKKGREKR